MKKTRIEELLFTSPIGDDASVSRQEEIESDRAIRASVDRLGQKVDEIFSKKMKAA